MSKMFPSIRNTNRASCSLILLCVLTFINQTSALTIEYCSDINTSSQSKNSSIYQSNGLCHNFCISSYAFAIVQDDGCWCSNYAPASTTTGCTQTCPGYPSDICGGNGVYGYIALTIAPSGTEGATEASTAAPSTTAAQVTTVTASPDPTTIVQTVTETPAAPSSTFETSTSSTTSASPTPTSTSEAALMNTPTAATSSSETSSTWTPTPVTSLETVTGQVRTVTVTPTVPPNSGSSSSFQKSSGGGGLSTGAAVGLTIGLVALVAIVCSVVYFCMKKRREQQAEEYNNMNNDALVRRGSSAGLGGPVPSRTMSENSRYVLGTDGRQVVESWENGDDAMKKNRMVPVDQRLDPFAPVYRTHSKSESIHTIQDDRDYSRGLVDRPKPILRATNPDPDSTAD